MTFHKTQKENDCDPGIFEMMQVIEELKKARIENVFLDFSHLVAEQHVPTDNIAFLLWVEVVRWYKSENTCSIRYMQETRKFGNLDRGGKFVHFISGFKNTCAVSSRGTYAPLDSDINFAVPDISVLRQFALYGLHDSDITMVGIYTDIMHTAAEALLVTRHVSHLTVKSSSID